jgi:hypothetical protein
MELTKEQEARFRNLCKEIKPGEYGRVEVSFMGSPTNLVQFTVERNYRFHNERAAPTQGEPQDRQGSGRYGN